MPEALYDDMVEVQAGADADRGADEAAQLECGTAWVNTHLALVPSAIVMIL